MVRSASFPRLSEQRLWPRVKFVLLTLIALPVTAFAIYCVWRGFAEHRILALSRSGTLISPESHPIFFWASFCGWGWLAVGIPVHVCRRAKAILG